MTEREIALKIELLNMLFKEIQVAKAAQPELRCGYYTSNVGSLLNAYREGDIGFTEAIELIREAFKPLEDFASVLAPMLSRVDRLTAENDALRDDIAYCRRAWTAAEQNHLGAEDARRREVAKAQAAAQKQAHEIQQILGAALGYPRFCDDPVNFPCATESDGVTVGDHSAESLATEAANKIRALQRRNLAAEQERDKLRALIPYLIDPYPCCLDDDGHCNEHAWRQPGECPQAQAKAALEAAEAKQDE